MDPCSSAPWFSGWSDLAKSCSDGWASAQPAVVEPWQAKGPPVPTRLSARQADTIPLCPVVPATTWLATKGWRTKTQARPDPAQRVPGRRRRHAPARTRSPLRSRRSCAKSLTLVLVARFGPESSHCLRAASLRAASLHAASLRAASLRAASLHAASLRAASLHAASLRAASLHAASLHAASLHAASLHAGNRSEGGLPIS